MSNMLIETLARAGSSELCNLLGVQTTRLLVLMGIGAERTAVLARLVVDQVGADQLLSTRSTRELILESLPEDHASRLVSLLGFESQGPPWRILLQRPFRPSSNESAVLFAFFGSAVPEAERSTLLPATRSIAAAYPLFSHQIRAAKSVMLHLAEGTRPRVLLHMPTGAGKTRTAMNVIAEKLRSELINDEVVLWLAHSEELCEQAAEEFAAAWSAIGNRDLSVHRFFGNQKADISDIECGFVVGGLQLLHGRSKSNQSEFLAFARRVALVVLDEAHMAIAPSYQHLLEMLAANPTTGILGLSATPGRSTIDAHQDVLLAEFFKRNKVTLEIPGYDNPVEFLQSEGYLAKVDYEYVEYKPTEDFSISLSEANSIRDGFDLSYEIIRRLGTETQRNFLIINRIKQAVRLDEKIIVFACSVDHARLLANLLRAEGVKAAFVTGETRLDRRRRIIQQYRDTDEIQVLTNYGVLTTGFDAPRTNMAFITRPTNSVVLYSQMVGRAARGVRAGGNAACKVVTVIDKIPGFRSMAEAFTYWDDIWE